MSTEFYVYAWLKKDGSPYYIGKGKNNRAWRKGCGKVQIIASNLTEEEAFKFESLLIKKIGRKDLNEGPLHNKNDGMIGGDVSKYESWQEAMRKRDYSGSNNPNYGKDRRGLKSGAAVTPLFGKTNGMYGTKRSSECSNKRMKCPLCEMESNSSNIKRHLNLTHNVDWKDYV